MRSLGKLKTWINENCVEVHGIKVISVISVIKKIEEIEEGQNDFDRQTTEASSTEYICPHN